MARWQKFLIGLGAALLVGWIFHGPLGGGAAFIDALEARAEARLAAARLRSPLPGITVRMRRDPLAREAILSGPADEFQREGLGSYPGLNDRIGTIPGIAAVGWDGPAACCARGR